MARLCRTGWAKLIALAAIGFVAVGTLAVAGVGFPLFPEPLPGAKGPGQRWGSAEGRDHLAVDGTNRTTGQSLRAKYPLRAPSVRKAAEGRNTATVGTPPTPAAVTGFDRATSEEIVSERDAHSRTYANADGTETTELSTTPLHFRDRAGAWQTVDPALVASDGGWTGAAGSVDVRLAGRADAERLAAVTLPSGESFAYGLEGAAAAKGSAGDAAEGGAADSRVSYREVLPETDLWLDSRAGGVKETLVLRSTDAPTSFDFPLTLTGLTAKPGTAQLGGEGSVILVDDRGRTKAVIPAGFMEDANGAVSHAVRYELITRDGGQALRVGADRDWLADPARAFPVRLDPSVDTTTASRSMYVTENGPVAGSNELHVGKGTAGSTASYLGFPGLDTELRNHKIFGAQLQVVNYDAPSCKPRSVSVHPVTQSWTTATGGSYPGPSVGGSLASKSFAYGHIAVGSSKSGCPAAGELFDLGKGGRDLVQRWVDGSQPNYGLSLRASASDPLGFKKFTGDTTANPPKLFVTHSPYNASYSFPK
ncbi:DNRLRE domain-containing protein, partial [Streptomyces sp. NPDC056730]